MSAQTGKVDIATAVRTAATVGPAAPSTGLPTPGVGPSLVQVRLNAQPEALKPGKGKNLESSRNQRSGQSALAGNALATAFVGAVEELSGPSSGRSAQGQANMADAARNAALTNAAKKSTRALGRAEGIIAHTYANGGVVSLGIDRYSHIDKYHISTPPHARTR